MKKSAIFSALFHSILLIILLVGIPMPQRQIPVNEMPMIMEFEKIADVSAAPKLTPEASKEDKKAIKKTEPKKEPEKPKEESVKEETIKPKEEPEAQKKPEPKKEVEKPKEEMKEADPIPEPKKEKAKEKPKKLEPKKEPKKEKKEEKPTKAEVNLDPKKTKPKPLSSSKKKSVDDIVDSLISDTLESDGAERGAPASTVGEAITATDIDAIRQKIYKCWLIPIGVQGAKDLVVDVRMDIAQDGNVTKAEVVNNRTNDPAFQAAAESAQRAVLDPACNPLPLPPEKYEKWKRLTLRFNPKDMY